MSNSLRDLLIAWSLLPFLTPNRTRLLRETFDDLCGACKAPSKLLRSLLNIDEAEAAAVRNPLQNRAFERYRDSTITLADADYPARLANIIDPPLVLHFRGRRELLAEYAIAVVGSRRASPYALNAARHFVQPLASDAKLVIVSGLAAGVDAAAHAAALDARGSTIAVLGTGIDIIYPRANRALFRRIEAEGLIVSEFPPATPPRKLNFPIRNRVISGLSLGTVIVEATGRSGSLITARTAAEQGREVFAVPGSIFSGGTEGTHRLIQYGAKLVHEVNDITSELKDLAHLTIGSKKEEAPPDSPLREVLDALSRDEGVNVDTAAFRVGRSVHQIAESLLQLELAGWVKSLPGARYVRLR
jgi:DNA processing protein